MCGGYTSEKRLSATGVLNSLKNSEWLAVAEELSELNEKDFGKLLRAFRLYREAKRFERNAEYMFPKRNNGSKTARST